MDYKHTPKTKTALIAAIREEIKLQGERANLNCIDTTAITNMREIFAKFKSFNGDISSWNVSNVKDMSGMFSGSSFNGDISGWDVRNVVDMSYMFSRSSFKGDISRWDVSRVEYFFPMFVWARIPMENRPLRFRMNRDADSPELNGKIRFWDDTEASFSLTGDGVLTVCGDLGCNLDSDFYRRLDGDIPVRKLIIAEGVTTIGERMFYEWRRLEEITFPESLTEIKDRAFEGCHNILRLNFPKRGLLKIGSSVFSSCAVRELHLPETLTYIGAYTFEGFKELEELVIPDSVESVGNRRVFKGCTSLKSVKLPAHLKTITESMFYGCTALEHVQMPDDLETIENYAFYDCPNLKSIDLPDSVKAISDGAFETVEFEDGGLQYCIPAIISNGNCCSVCVDNWEGPLTIPSKVCYNGKEYVVTEIDDFRSCEKMTEVYIPDTIAELPVQAFSGCVRLKKVELPDTITEIPEEAFDGCWRLREVRLGFQTRVIGENAFRGCEFLQHLHLPESVNTICSYAFQDCKNLVDLNMPASVSHIGLYAFEKTPLMHKEGLVYLGHVLCGYNGTMPPHACLEVKEGTTLIAEAALRECRNLESVILPETLECIGYEAFYGCRNLKHVYLPKSLRSLGSGVFDWTAITTVEVPWETPIVTDYRPFPKNAEICVPKGAMESYKTAKYWQDYELVERDGPVSETYAFITDETVFIGREQPQRLILIEKPQRKKSLSLYGIVVDSRYQVNAKQYVKDLLYESFRDTAAFLDWEEDSDFGSGAPLGNLLEYDKHRFTIVELPADVSPKTVTINDKKYLTDEELYKSLVSNTIDWINLI